MDEKAGYKILPTENNNISKQCLQQEDFIFESHTITKYNSRKPVAFLPSSIWYQKPMNHCLRKHLQFNPGLLLLPHKNHSHKVAMGPTHQASLDACDKQLIKESECHQEHLPISFQ